ncbi:hypothetical protein [Tenacibaculum mesophilum]|uniref:hypothetical protein n=1 Tax=Tenacibaculum mesophilum TaxID=104268 RepID=UPI002492913F|nr:hypothetical protein [Tenacibaculum mesophilum]
MKKLLVLFLFVGLVCNTYAFNNVNANSVNDTEQIVFPENTQEVTTAVADFNCDIQNVAVYLSMVKITFNRMDYPCSNLENTTGVQNLNILDDYIYGAEFSIEGSIMFENTHKGVNLDHLITAALVKKGYHKEVETNLEQFAKSDRCLIVTNHQTRPYEHTLLVDDKPICKWIYPDPTIKKEGDKFTATYLEFTEL